MPGYAGYPSGTDLKAFLQPVVSALGKTLPAQVNYDQRAAKARQYFEGQIGRVLLAVSGVRRFDPPTNPRGILDLGADLISVTSLTVSGQALVEDTDFFLEPYNSAEDEKPYRRIEFAVQRWQCGLSPTLRKSVVITGPWGYSLTVPELAWDAILAQAAISCYPELSLLVSKGTQMRKEGDVETMYARGQNSGPLIEEMRTWQQRVTDGITTFQCVEVGL